jgi:hypothetical protein
LVTKSVFTTTPPLTLPDAESPESFCLETMENLLKGMRLIAQTNDAIYIRIPTVLQAPGAFTGGDCSCGHCDGSGNLDTLMVPTHGKFTTTVHMPDRAVQLFIDMLNYGNPGRAWIPGGKT